MKMPLVKAAVVAVFCFLLAGVAKADTTCSSTTPPFVCFTFTNVGSDGPGVFDVMMEATISNPSSTGFGSFAVNFNGATSVNLESFPSGGGWAFIGNHSNNPGGCNLSSSPTFTFCFQGLSNLTSGTPLDFVFDVSEGSAPTSTHIQAFQGGPLAISNDVGIGAPPSVPEPGSLSLLGLGLLGLPYLRRRRS